MDGDGDAVARAASCASWPPGWVSPSGCASRAAPATRCPAPTRAADAILFPVAWPSPGGSCRWRRWRWGARWSPPGLGGSGEYLRDGENALLFKARDADALAAAVRRLAGDLPER